MKETLADMGLAPAAQGTTRQGATRDVAGDGLTVLEQNKSTAETFGIPLAVLAELTHRCPLQCPYCSNPVELDRGGSELTTEEWKKVLTELAEKYAAPREAIATDVVAMLQDLADKGFLTEPREKTS